MSRRDQIRMSDAEVLAFLDEERTVVCATNGRRGWPHLMPLWYVLRPTGDAGAPQMWAWTFAKSQKAKNLERDAARDAAGRGRRAYEQLRGVMLECDVTVHRDVDLLRGVRARAVRALRRASTTACGRWSTQQAPKRDRAAVRRALARDVGPPQARRRLLEAP